MTNENKSRTYQDRKAEAIAQLYEDDVTKDQRMANLVERQQVWDDLFANMRKIRDLMLEDNGGTRERDLEDPWLAYMIARMDEIIGHWDPDASAEEVAMADMQGRRPPRRRN